MAVHVKDLLDLFGNEMGDLIQALVEQYRLPEQEALRLWQLPEEERAGAIADIVERGLGEAQYGPPYGPPVVPGEPNPLTTPIVQLIPKPTGVQTTQDFSETMFSPDTYSNIEIPQLPDLSGDWGQPQSSIPSLLDSLSSLGGMFASPFGEAEASMYRPPSGPVATPASTYSDVGSYMGGQSGSPGTLGVTGTPSVNINIPEISALLSNPKVSTDDKIKTLIAFRTAELQAGNLDRVDVIDQAIGGLQEIFKIEQSQKTGSGAMTEYQRAALANQNAQLAWAKEQAAMQDAWNREKFAQEQLWKQQTDKMDRETAMKNELQRIREARAAMQMSGATAMSNAAARQAEILGELAKYAVGDRIYWPGYEPGGIVQNRNAAWGMPFTPQKFTVTPVNVNVTGVAQDLVNKALAGIQ
jgi:hypothetical protein